MITVTYNSEGIRVNVKEISKYTKRRKPFTGYISGTPAHVKSAINFNDVLSQLTPIFNEVYKDISNTKAAQIIYKSSIENPSLDSKENTDKIMEKLLNNRGAELERGLTLTGPHRDDLTLMLGEHLVKGYASHGESWSIALSLKLATYQLLKSDGLSPILILDDVFSELDEERREKLAQLAQSAEQTIITVAVENDLPKSLTGAKYLVKSAAVSKL